MGYENGNQEFVVYTNLIVGSNDVLFASAHHTEDEAWEEARAWLTEECGGTEADYEMIRALSNEEVLDKILDYDYIAYVDVAVRKVLY